MPLGWWVGALGLGCVAGGLAGLDPEPAARLALLASALLVVSARVAWGSHELAPRMLAIVAAAGLGVGLGALAEGRAWAPPGVDVDALTRATQAGDIVKLAGVLRRDAWLSDAGDVALDLDVARLWWRGHWRPTTVGVRVTIGGESAVQQLTGWTRGRQVEATVSSIRRPLPYRNFDVPDAERALARRGTRLFVSVKSAALVSTSPGPWWEELAARTRVRIRAAVRGHVRDPVAAATVTAILIGDRSSLSNDLVRNLQHAGVYHVVAISGGNVGIWLALLIWLPRMMGSAFRVAALWLAFGLLGFALVVDGGASVARAVSVAAVVIAARWWDVRACAAQALLAAAAIQLLTNPLTLHDPGCVLSFGAAGTLVFLSRLTPVPWRRSAGLWRDMRAKAIAALGVLVGATLAIELVLLPITARWFHLATVAGLFANLLAVPAMAVVQVTALALLAATPIWPAAAGAIGNVAAAGVHTLLRSADVVALAPWLVRDVPPPSLTVLVLYYVALGGLAGCLRHVTRRPARAGSTCARAPRRLVMTALAASALTVASGLAWIGIGGFERSAPSPWTWPIANDWQRAAWPHEPWLLITILDVGQGDATVIRFPSGRTWLIDAGGSVSETFDLGARVTAPALWALGHRRLDRVLVTHAHPDHASGMPGVIRRFSPRELLTGVPVTADLRQQGLSDAAREVAARERRLAAGESLSDGPVQVSVRHPERPDWERRRVRNDDSVVLWVRHGDVGLLLPGDIGEAVEHRLAPRLPAAPLTVLRLAHHGSASSTSRRLLDAVNPVLAIGSMGRANRFGHPAPTVLRRLEDLGVPLLRTDEVGAIQLATNGRVLLVRTMAGLQASFTAGPPRRAWWLATPLPSDRASRPGVASRPLRDVPRPIRNGE